MADILMANVAAYCEFSFPKEFKPLICLVIITPAL